MNVKILSFVFCFRSNEYLTAMFRSIINNNNIRVTDLYCDEQTSSQLELLF